MGGVRSGGRWHHRGVPVVYLAESAALAMLESLIHFELAPDEVPTDYQLLQVDCPDAIEVASLDHSPLPANWPDDRAFTRRLGTDWLASLPTALLKVPSAVVPNSFNFLLNPRHEDAARVTIQSANRHPFDVRLFRDR